MRHLWSFLSGIAVAPLCWLLVAVGQTTSTRTIGDWVSDGEYHTATLLGPAALLFAAGLLLGLLGTLRFSPLGPLAAGLALAAPYVATFIDPFGTRDLLGVDAVVFGEPIVLLTPVDNGTLALLGVLLSTAVLSRRRWSADRRTGDPTPAEPAAPAAEPLPVRPLGEFDPSLWSLPGGPTEPAPAATPTAPTAADPTTGGRTGTTTTLTATAADTDADRLRPARPIPRSARRSR
ncbi:hypothetical protein O7623_16065 [Solwaraspora sp. WMMD791]|uniref:hypothetical protein n=1 Tax=Solwaraspora sp. WMMD791 TaxID=3016086 RepID=UPI00249AD6F6|nr:hypothetical protein [Solwaraspora sp. WMMD791]WFE24947.1 hypothetical protein O7623_16065 [Solwaraspora sp. WMMD791]